MEKANEEKARAELVRTLLGKEREIAHLEDRLAAKDQELLAHSQVIPFDTLKSKTSYKCSSVKSLLERTMGSKSKGECRTMNLTP